jgi:hypothetical protein
MSALVTNELPAQPGRADDDASCRRSGIVGTASLIWS